MERYNQKGRDFARTLRKNMTPEEVKLWCALRRKQVLGCLFRRQVPIGPYVVDFCCESRKLIVEADGSHHNEGAVEGGRDGFLRARGYLVMRFWNQEIRFEFPRVMMAIGDALLERANG